MLCCRLLRRAVVVVIMAAFALAALSCIVSARKWFTGPIRTIEDNYIGEYDQSEKDGADLQVNEREVSDSEI